MCFRLRFAFVHTGGYRVPRIKSREFHCSDVCTAVYISHNPRVHTVVLPAYNYHVDINHDSVSRGSLHDSNALSQALVCAWTPLGIRPSATRRVAKPSPESAFLRNLCAIPTSAATPTPSATPPPK